MSRDGPVAGSAHITTAATLRPPAPATRLAHGASQCLCRAITGTGTAEAEAADDAVSCSRSVGSALSAAERTALSSRSVSARQEDTSSRALGTPGRAARNSAGSVSIAVYRQSRCGSMLAITTGLV